jgi:hypothetical protein
MRGLWKDAQIMRTAARHGPRRLSRVVRKGARQGVVDPKHAKANACNRINLLKFFEQEKTSPFLLTHLSINATVVPSTQLLAGLGPGEVEVYIQARLDG